MSAKLMRHQIFERLRGDIMSCGLQPGEEVRESALAQKYGVSKSPIRDALQKLEWEGLVEIAPRQGHRVAPISISDARDILEMREILDAAAVRKIVVDSSDDALERLNEFRTTDVSDLKSFVSYNRDFHSRLATMSGNLRQSAAMRALMDNYERLCIVSLSSRQRETEAMTTALAEHNAIIDALQARDGRRAARLSVQHIRKSHLQVMRGLRSQQIVP